MAGRLDSRPVLNGARIPLKFAPSPARGKQRRERRSRRDEARRKRAARRGQFETMPHHVRRARPPRRRHGEERSTSERRKVRAQSRPHFIPPFYQSKSGGRGERETGRGSLLLRFYAPPLSHIMINVAIMAHTPLLRKIWAACPPLLDIRTVYHHPGYTVRFMEGAVSDFDRKIYAEIMHNCIIKYYPDGSSDALCASRPVFRSPGWELAEGSRALPASVGNSAHTSAAENSERAKRRACAALADYARCNAFTHFCTLTLSPETCNRYDIDEIIKLARGWLSNRVQRKGLIYLLVPELHKDGAIHFHGLINSAAVTLRDSGTISFNGGKPRRPRSLREREKWLAEGGHVVYNIYDWPYGFSTAIELYGERRAAISYVCKYIGKSGSKIGGRWYYSGGALARPEKEFCDVDFDEISQNQVGKFEIPRLGVECVKVCFDSGGVIDGI